jgi:hypothetical protein
MNAQTRLHMSPPACAAESGVAAGVEKVLATTPRRLLSDSPPGEASDGDCANGDTTAAALASVRNTAETRLVGGEVTSAGAPVRVSGSTPARSGLASFFFLRFAGGDASSALLADARRSRLDARVARGERARFFETLGLGRGSSSSALAVGATSGGGSGRAFATRASAPFLNARSAALLVLNVPSVLQVRVAGSYALTL